MRKYIKAMHAHTHTHTHSYIYIHTIAELKGRTSSQLPLLNQSVSAIRRDDD